MRWPYRIRHGWYVGSEEFGVTLLQKVKEQVGAHKRLSYGGGAVRQHDEREAEELLQWGLRTLDLTEGDLVCLPKGHAHKCALAHLVHSSTMASHQWLTARLHMGHPQNLTVYIKHAPQIAKPAMALLKASASSRNT